MNRFAALACAALALAAALPSLAAAEDRATTKDAQLLVQRAVEFLKQEGKEKALPVFSDPKGPFSYRDLYVVALDPKAVVLAHGAKKELIGKNDWNSKDADGKFFARSMVEIGASQGKGWYEYKFQNPASGKVETKVAYLERVGDVIVLCGAYRQ
jgi:hypothetical protein